MNLTFDRSAGFVPIPPAGEQLIVGCLDVADMRDDRKANSPFVEILRGGRAPDPAAVLEAGVLGDGVLRTGGTARKQLTHPVRKLLHVLAVDARAPLRLPFSTTFARIIIGQALCFGPRQSRFLDQNTLSLVTVAGAAPLEDDSGQRRVLSGTARQRGIPGCQEDQVVEVSAGQAKCAAFPGKADPRAAPQFLTTFIASGLTSGDEHLQILRGLHDLTGLHLNWMAFAIQSLLSRGQCAQ